MAGIPQDRHASPSGHSATVELCSTYEHNLRPLYDMVYRDPWTSRANLEKVNKVLNDFRSALERGPSSATASKVHRVLTQTIAPLQRYMVVLPKQKGQSRRSGSGVGSAGHGGLNRDLAFMNHRDDFLRRCHELLQELRRAQRHRPTAR